MKYYLLFFIILFGTASMAQPVLTKAGNAPSHLDSSSGRLQNNATTANPGNAGPNQIWDLSGSQGDYNYTLMYRNISASDPIANQFPDATLVMVVPILQGLKFRYYSVGDSTVFFHGYVVDNDTSTPDVFVSAWRYDPPLEILRFPMTYGKNYSQDTVKLIRITNQGNGDTTPTLAYVEANAYGTFKNTNGKDYSVLRVSVNNHYLDENDVPNGNYLISHLFYSPDIPLPLHEIDETQYGSQHVESYYFTSWPFGNPSALVGPEPSTLNVYPNPAKPGDFIQLDPAIQVTPIQSIQLIALDGKSKSMEPQSGGFLIPADLKTGIYVYRIHSVEGYFDGKIAVQ